MSARNSWALGLALGVAIGAGAILLVVRPPAGAADAARPAPELSSSRRTAIVTAAQRVSPAVVSVSVVATRIVRQDPFGGVLRDEFWDRFYPPLTYKERIPGLGSGVIIDPSGLVLTNEHVVHDAEQVTVTLSDGRQLPAQVLGASSGYDLAVLKVQGRDLPVAALGNSDGLVVGEWAIAIGNPFGYLLNDPQPSVTAGVVSATRRDIKSEATASGVYKNMIQTDASINPGNSGGPLVNADGQVVGINTFIFTQGGGSLGIGFAIPINLARRVVDEIQRYGRVRSAWTGMLFQPITPYLAERLGYRDLNGMLVTRVETRGPADRAGVRVGDRIRRVNGVEIRTVDDAQTAIYGASVGDRLVLVVERGDRRLELALVLAEAPRDAR